MSRLENLPDDLLQRELVRLERRNLNDLLRAAIGGGSVLLVGALFGVSFLFVRLAQH